MASKTHLPKWCYELLTTTGKNEGNVEDIFSLHLVHVDTQGEFKENKSALSGCCQLAITVGSSQTWFRQNNFAGNVPPQTPPAPLISTSG